MRQSYVGTWEDVVLPEKRMAGVRRNESGRETRETGYRCADVGLDDEKDFGFDPENWMFILGSFSGGKEDGVRSVKKRHLLLGLTFYNLTVLAVEIFQSLTWRVGVLRSRNRPPGSPKFVSLPVALPWGFLQV